MATIKYLNENGEYEEVSTIKIVEEGGGESDGGSQMEYWACPPVEGEEDREVITVLAPFASQTRVEVSTSVIVASVIYTDIMPYSVKALSFDMSCPIVMGDDTLSTVGEVLAALGVDLETIGFTRITKEQFYALEQWS